MENRFYSTFSSAFATFTIVWKEFDSDFQIQRIFLSDPEFKSEAKALESFDQIRVKSISSIKLLAEKIQRFFNGDKVQFDLEKLDFNKCYSLQKKVLLTEYEIPRGWISTYKRIAQHLGMLKSARVVGNSLAKNPFPIIIPCHRAIRTDGGLGGFQGGIEMKRKLLELEGIKFSDKGKVIFDNVYF
jgi:methylated-DNA-[protein]-cysteine S-methyltransferase